MPPAADAAAVPFDAVIVAGGSGSRMGFDKLAAPLGGQSVLALSVAAVASTPGCGAVVLVCRPERREEYAALAGPVAGGLLFADAGAERQDSVASGLARLAALPGRDAARLAAIHDAARPLVPAEAILAVVAEAARSGAAALAAPVADTLMRAGADGGALGPVPRENLWAMQTPQVFRLGLVTAALETARASGAAFTDDVSAVLAAGHPVRLVRNSAWNPKITYPPDLELAAALVAARAWSGGAARGEGGA